MLVNLHVHPVANLKVLQCPAHSAHGGRLANLDVGFRRERDGNLAAIVKPDDSEALGMIEMANLTLDQRPHPLPKESARSAESAVQSRYKDDGRGVVL